ncbi:MAG: tRNA pseudouridine(55) synthase TruB [Candidatus Omnitrophota bacterium]
MDGVLLVDKPERMTSHDVVDFIRRRFRIKKVGHAGTLDPMATGLLVILLGKSTKDSLLFSGQEKGYEATMVLGVRSDTGDADGMLTDAGGDAAIERETLNKAFEAFLGEIDQVPPMYSAVKYKGKKLYELARRGIAVKREPRRVIIRSLSIHKYDFPVVEFSVECSKGTYVRQLCIDIGERLGCGAHLTRLRRVRSGGFTVERSVALETLKERPRDSIGDLITKRTNE